MEKFKCKRNGCPMVGHLCMDYASVGNRCYTKNKLNCIHRERTYSTKPSGLVVGADTLEDSFKRADKLSSPNGDQHSAMLIENKDLRRIVMLVREVRDLQDQIRELKECLKN